MPLTSDVLREIGALSRTIHAICDAKYKALKLQKGQFIFLTRICENRGVIMKDLSIMLKVDKTTTTKAVNKLIDRGYIHKEKDTKDQRVHRLYPNDKTLEIYDMLIEEENRAIAICFQGFTPDEKELVLTLVNRMKENIDQDWREMKNYKGEKL